MAWISDNLSGILVFLGIGLLGIEMLVFAFSSFILFFVGLACVLTGLLMYIGVMPQTLVFALVSVAVLSIGLAVSLWKPFKRLQNNVGRKTADNDLIGHSFILSGGVSPQQSVVYKYSGIEWKVKSSETLTAGTEVEVIKTEVGEFTVGKKVPEVP